MEHIFWEKVEFQIKVYSGCDIEIPHRYEFLRIEGQLE